MKTRMLHAPPRSSISNIAKFSGAAAGQYDISVTRNSVNFLQHGTDAARFTADMKIAASA